MNNKSTTDVSTPLADLEEDKNLGSGASDCSQIVIPKDKVLKDCPWCGKPPQRLRTLPERDYDDPCGKVVIRCITYQCPINCVEFKPDRWNTRSDASGYVRGLSDAAAVAHSMAAGESADTGRLKALNIEAAIRALISQHEVKIK